MFTAADDVILLAVHGSRAYGTDTADSDHDLLGVYRESDAQIFGLQEAKTRATNLGRKSTAADTDVTLHPVRKYVSLAAVGNPTILTLLWSTPDLIQKCTPAGQLLMDSRDLFVTRRALTAHLGFATSQRKAPTKGAGRRELIAAHGYDTKAALHAVRILLAAETLAAETLADEAQYLLPMPADQLELLSSIRHGQLSLTQVMTLIDSGIARVEERLDSALLPPRPDVDAVNELLVEILKPAG